MSASKLRFVTKLLIDQYALCIYNCGNVKEIVADFSSDYIEVDKEMPFSFADNQLGDSGLKKVIADQIMYIFYYYTN